MVFPSCCRPKPKLEEEEERDVGDCCRTAAAAKKSAALKTGGGVSAAGLAILDTDAELGVVAVGGVASSVASAASFVSRSDVQVCTPARFSPEPRLKFAFDEDVDGAKVERVGGARQSPIHLAISTRCCLLTRREDPARSRPV